MAKVDDAYEAPVTGFEHPVDVRPTLVQGSLPPELRGSLYRVGAGRLQVGPDPLHLLDAHGAIGVLRLERAEAVFRWRILRTPDVEVEQQAGRMGERGVYTNLPRPWDNFGRLPRRHHAAHDVALVGGRLMALGDRGAVEVHPETLDTLGPLTFGERRPLGALLSAMPRLDPDTGRLVTFFQTPGGYAPDKLTFEECTSDGRAVISGSVRLGRSPALLHDLAFTAAWFVGVELPARLALLPALSGLGTVFGSLRWPEWDTASAVLVPRVPGEEARRVSLPASIRAVFHIANAWDDGARVVLDLVAYDGTPDLMQLAPAALRPPPLAHAGTPRLQRVVLHPQHGVHEVLPGVGCVGELPEVDPRVHGRPSRHTWLLSPGASPAVGWPWYTSISRVDEGSDHVDAWHAGSGTFLSQPAFAPGGSLEGEGWVLVWARCTRPHATQVLVFEALNLSKGPIATLNLGVPLPAPTHALWVGAD